MIIKVIRLRQEMHQFGIKKYVMGEVAFDMCFVPFISRKIVFLFLCKIQNLYFVANLISLALWHKSDECS